MRQLTVGLSESSPHVIQPIFSNSDILHLLNLFFYRPGLEQAMVYFLQALPSIYQTFGHLAVTPLLSYFFVPPRLFIGYHGHWMMPCATTPSTGREGVAKQSSSSFQRDHNLRN